MNELKPCPFCGKEFNIRIVTDEIHKNEAEGSFYSTRVICGSCDASGPRVTNEDCGINGKDIGRIIPNTLANGILRDKAVEEWNRRVEA